MSKFVVYNFKIWFRPAEIPVILSEMPAKRQEPTAHVHSPAIEDYLEQIHNLIDAGQKRIIADGIYSWDEYKAMKQEFHSELDVVAIITPKHLRYHRLLTRSERPQTEAISIERDHKEIETIDKGGPIAMADYFVINDGDKEKLHRDIDAIVSDIGF